MRQISSYRMKNWLSSASIAAAAEAIRADSTSVATATADIGPTWRDLGAVFDAGFSLSREFYLAGDHVTSFGNDVARGGSNIANYMEDCAQTIQQVERTAPSIIERADKFNAWLAAAPPLFPPFIKPPEGLSDLFPTAAVPEHEGEWSFLDYTYNDYLAIKQEVDDACAIYGGAIYHMTEQIKSLDDDGSTPSSGWRGVVVDIMVIGGAVIGIFIPPVGVAATAVGAIKVYTDEYQERRRELLEEHPEMYDKEISQQSLRAAVIAGTLSALENLVLAKVGGTIAKKLANGDPLDPFEQRVIEAAIGELTAAIPEPGNSGPNTDSPDHAQGAGVPGLSAAQQEQAIEDAKQTIRTKDYDGDGYTDNQYLPDAEKVERGFYEPAEEVHAPPTLWDRLAESMDDIAAQVLNEQEQVPAPAFPGWGPPVPAGTGPLPHPGADSPP